MPGPNPAPFQLPPRQREALKRIERRQLAPQNLVRRMRIVLEVSRGTSNTAIAERLHVNRNTVITWRGRYAEAQSQLADLASDQLGEAIDALLADQPRSGAPPTFSAEEMAQIMALACQDPQTPADRSATGPRAVCRRDPGDLRPLQKHRDALRTRSLNCRET